MAVRLLERGGVAGVGAVLGKLTGAFLMRRARTSMLCAFLPALAGMGAACCPDTFYELLAPAPTVRLPADEEPHCSGGEWWYYTGTVSTDDGRSYGIEAVIFHVPAAVLRLPVNAWVAHFSVLDETTGVFVYDQDRLPGPLMIARPASEGFDLYTPLVQMSGLSGHDHVHASMSDGSYVVDLDLEDLKGAVLHGGHGYIPYGADGWSFYYSGSSAESVGELGLCPRPWGFLRHGSGVPRRKEKAPLRQGSGAGALDAPSAELSLVRLRPRRA